MGTQNILYTLWAYEKSYKCNILSSIHVAYAHMGLELPNTFILKFVHIHNKSPIFYEDFNVLPLWEFWKKKKKKSSSNMVV